MRRSLAAGLCGLGTAVVAAVPQWIVNHGPDAARAIVQQGSFSEALGIHRIDVTGYDATFSMPMGADDAFAAAERPFFAVRYRVSSKIPHGGLFFTTDTLTSLSDASYSQFPVVGDGTWRTMVVDMRVLKPNQWKGTIRSFRLDPTNPSAVGDTIEISRLGFFPTQAEGEAFLAAADDTEDFTRPMTLKGTRCTALVPAGAARAGWTRADYLPKEMALPSGTGPVAVVRDGEPVPCRANSRGYVWYVADRPGDYRLVRGTPKPLSDEQARSLECVPSPRARPASSFARERIRLGGWGLFRTGKWNRQTVRDYADCGLDFLIGTGAESGALTARLLDACDEDGIEVVLMDGAATKPEMAGLAYADHPSYRGHYFTDEPGSDDFDRWGARVKACQAVSDKTPFINLLPMYANAAQLKYGAQAAAIEYYDPDPDLYRKHCEAYCDKVPTPYICTDIYPLNWVKDRPHTYAHYVESINVIASVARARGREFWCCIQTFGWIGSKRTPTAAEFRWQCYSLLSFGCRGILCWVYTAYNEDFPSLLTLHGERTAAWYDARTVFREIRAISDVYCRYRGLGAFTHNCTDRTPYLKMSGEDRACAPIRRIVCDGPLLVGGFAAKEGTGRAFTLVNMDDFATARSRLAKLDVDGRTVTVYRRGAPEKSLPGEEGLHDIPLEPGEGVFVTVD